MSSPPIEQANDDPNFNDEDNSPFGNQGIASLMSQHNLGPKRSSNSGEEQDDDDESELLYTTNSKNDQKAKSGDIYQASQINFESRVSKLLKSSGVVRVQITEAGNSNEGMNNSSKKYVVYTIKLINQTDPSEDIFTRRRYSDFESLREVLTKIFPLVVIPPIPPKNYVNFNVLNGFGHSSGQSHTAQGNGTGGSTGVGVVANVVNGSGAAGASLTGHSINSSNYTYINSTHLNKNRLIEHRKRLLTNFLNNCLEIGQIRNLEFFAKFLDPNSNWSDEINLISSQLPKSIYQSNPENGLRTDPIYSNLPSPSNGHMGFLKDNRKKLKERTNKILNNGITPTSQTDALAEQSSNSQVGETGSPDSEYILNTSSLDSINKKIMENFIGLSNDYTELGTVFNSFSLVLTDTPRDAKGKSALDDEPKLNIIFDKIGQVFDRSYITINALIGDLETKFSEPLGEAVQFSSILQHIQKYQVKKIRQKQLLDSDLKVKKKDLEGLLSLEEESSRIESGLNPVVKNTKYDFDSKSSNQANQQTTSASKLKFKFPSIKKITQYVSDIIDQNPEHTRKQKITSLQVKVKTLEKCQNIMLEDISYIADELNKNFKLFHSKQLKMIYEILLSYNGFLIGWAKKNIDIWEEVREEVMKL